MTNVESMDYTHSHLSAICQPLRYRTLPFLTSRCGANFAGASKPRNMIRSITHIPPYIFLKTSTIPFMASPQQFLLIYLLIYLLPIMAFPQPFRDILPRNFHHSIFMTHIIIVILLCMIIQLTWYLWLSHRSSFFIHVTLDHCTSWYIARGIHIASYFVIGIEL